MFALTLDQASTIGAVAVGGLLVLAVIAAWLTKEITQKIALAVILGLLAVLVWTQRASLQECADKVQAGGVNVDTTCSFFGRDIEISRTLDSS